MLVQTNQFIVLERGKMQEILTEQGFQQSGCTTTECAAEVGKILNVQKMVSGTIGKLGEVYTIDLVLIDVKTAQIEKSFTKDYEGKIEGLLEIMKTIANQIADISNPGSAKTNESQIYTIAIDSNPGDAEVFINDKKVGKTPFNNKVQEGLELVIRIKKTNYQDWTKRIEITDNINIMAELEVPKEGKIKEKLFDLGIQSGIGFSSIQFENQKPFVVPFGIYIGMDLLPGLNAGLGFNYLLGLKPGESSDVYLYPTHYMDFGAFLKWYLPLKNIGPYFKVGGGFYSGVLNEIDYGEHDIESVLGFTASIGSKIRNGLFAEVMFQHFQDTNYELSINNWSLNIGYQFSF